jgi:hypothetical protein
MDGCETKMDGLVLEVRWKVSSKPCGKYLRVPIIHCWEDLILTQGDWKVGSLATMNAKKQM